MAPVCANAALSRVMVGRLLGFVCTNRQDFAREGFAARDRQQHFLAARLLSEALKKDHFTAEQRGFLLYSRGASYETMGLRVSALGDLDAAIALLPDFANAYVYRALIWTDRKEFDSARDDLLQSLRLSPNNALIHNNLGSVYEHLGEPDLAIESFGNAIRLNPKYAQAFYNRAHALVTKRDYRAAIDDYNRAIELQSRFADAFSNRGGAYLLLGENEKAIKDFDEAIRLSGNDAVFWSNRANAHLAGSRYHEALADFDRAIAIDPGRVATYVGRGQARLYAQEASGAVDDLRIAARLRPINPYPAIWMHIARVHQGNPDIEELERNASRVSPGKWPAQVLEFYLGKSDAGRIRQDAQHGSPAEVEKRLCEADFFIGERLHHTAAAADARRLLEQVVDRCRPVEVIFAAAKAELASEVRPR